MRFGRVDLGGDGLLKIKIMALGNYRRSCPFRLTNSSTNYKLTMADAGLSSLFYPFPLSFIPF